MIDRIVKYLEECDDAYYNTSNPLVSDATYDAIVESLRKLDPHHPYLSKVGARVKSNKVGRLVPMGTLSKYHKEEEIKKWLASEDDVGYVLLSPKYDGFAIELVYKDGYLISASTRGDGHVGEDILESAMRIRNIPIRLTSYRNSFTIVRGEAIIPAVHHEKIKSLGYTAMRNAVPGIVRSGRIDALGYVNFVAYEFIDGNDDRISQRVEYKKDFLIEDYRIYNTEEFDKMMERREYLRANPYEYELDGVVLKTAEIKEDDLLNPTHMIAWKYKSNRESTFLRGIEYQLGATGYFTPIGIFDPVEFQGATLTRASLGNMTRLYKEFDGMTIGSTIEVSRRGDIIPFIEDMLMIDEEGEKISHLKNCPHCHSLLEYDMSDGKLEPHCTNPECPEILRLKITQFVKSVGVKGIGDALVRSLIDRGYLKSINDIYVMSPKDILTIPRQGQSAVDKWETLQSKFLSPAELLTAYPFVDLGRKVWDTLLSRFTYQEILNLTKDELSSSKLKGIGSSKIDSIISQIADNKEELIFLGKYHAVLS